LEREGTSATEKKTVPKCGTDRGTEEKNKGEETFPWGVVQKLDGEGDMKKRPLQRLPGIKLFGIWRGTGITPAWPARRRNNQEGRLEEWAQVVYQSPGTKGLLIEFVLIAGKTGR